MNKIYKLWLKESLKISELRNGETFTCPNCLSHRMSYQYIGDLRTRIGYLLFWCDTCLKGIHISRTIIPTEVDFISYDATDEELNEKIPNFEKILS